MMCGSLHVVWCCAIVPFPGFFPVCRADIFSFFVLGYLIVCGPHGAVCALGEIFWGCGIVFVSSSWISM